MAPETTMRRATLVVVLLATVTLQAATWASHAHPWLALCDLSAVLLAIAGFAWLSRDSEDSLGSPRQLVFLIVLWCWPFVGEIILRGLFGYGQPLELQIVMSLRNIALALALLRSHVTGQKMACTASFFLVLFAFLLHLNTLTAVFAALCAMALVGWLIGAHWQRLQGKMPALAKRELPKRAASGAVAIVALLVAVGCVFASRSPAARQLRGFFPSSGGTHWADPHAWSGVGDGDQVVGAQEQADSFGAVDTDVFLESEMPSLFDVFDDTYGEPSSKPKKVERAVSLSSRPRDPTQSRAAKSDSAGRDFSAVRNGQRRRRELSDHEERALFFVAGHAPLHLRLETFDTFDGRTWTQSGTPRFFSHLRLDNSSDRPWIRTSEAGDYPLFRGSQEHTLKIVRLKTNRVPAPPQLAAVRIDMVDRVDMFGWTLDGALALPDRDAIPPLTVVHVRAHAVNLDHLREMGDFSHQLPRESPPPAAAEPFDPANASRDARIAQELAPFFELPSTLAEHRMTANDWVAGVPRGWRQVEAIVARLRENCTLDPHTVPPPSSEDVVAHFLKTHQGPDYLFASTAATLLRSLGYPTRLASGFYVRPERYDRAAAQTPVLAEDVHVWAEVCVDGYHWIAIEPTPGYDPPCDSRNLREAALAFITSVGQWVLHNAAAIAIVCVLAATCIVMRRWLAQQFALACWWIYARGSPRRRILWTVWLLDQRAMLARRSRPTHATLLDWHVRLRRELSPEYRECVSCLIAHADSLLYSEERLFSKSSESPSSSELPLLCLTVALGDCSSGAGKRGFQEQQDLRLCQS